MEGKPDLIIGNYTDGKLAASLMANKLGTTLGNADLFFPTDFIYVIGNLKITFIHGTNLDVRDMTEPKSVGLNVVISNGLSELLKVAQRQLCQERPAPEPKDRKLQKADKEKLRRDRLNEKFTKLGKTLDPERPKFNKATILGDTIQMLNDLTAQVGRLKSEYTTVTTTTEESREDEGENGTVVLING
ncbi:transcription factor bHLH121-like protein [Tanacetum coccineum]